ncbi:SGNH/GDSL hydrolase family protein [Streptomyces iconiensis]|uniref:SGNH/GDSL hydrolase family protein n=1 Tax=Streptomyces iconiensis TaxID=1384038 RepID=A0ABT6ZND1_9ACTN|nr:SGNH/GDSL hydrolase family protein [Streptomyces iconiensis]MDJ1130565.1 SGNH/GDSL hydrolase family protein [Streptomyces iconiensis]
MARFHTRLALLGSAAALTAGAVVPAQFAGAQPAAAADKQWVALGDSYTAGVIRATGDPFEVPRDGCERTDRAYPQVIDRDLGGLLDLTNVSCGAATIENVTDTPQYPTGRHLPPFSEDPDYPFPPVSPQSEAVGPDTDVITVGVGGNTLGFDDILRKCPELGGDGKGTPCKDALGDSIQARLNKVSKEYDGMLDVLHERVPKAKILTVGYPTIVPKDTSKCRYGDMAEFGPIAQGDLDWLRQDVLEPLNNRIEKSTGTQEAASFVDLYASSRNHSVCDENKWVEGFLTPPDQLSFVHPQRTGPPQRRRPRRRSDSQRHLSRHGARHPHRHTDSALASGTSRRPVPHRRDTAHSPRVRGSATSRGVRERRLGPNPAARGRRPHQRRANERPSYQHPVGGPRLTTANSQTPTDPDRTPPHTSRSW